MGHLDPGWAEVVMGILSILVALVAAYAKSLEKRCTNLEKFKDEVLRHWENEAKTYVSKSEFSEFAKDLKDSLVRIENKIEKLRE